MATHELFDQVLFYVNLYQHTKNQAISSIRSGDRNKNSAISLAENILAHISEAKIF